MFEYKFSVIITTYDSNENIKITIDSILSQSIGFKDNVELIIVNNGNKAIEDSVEDIKLYTEKYPDNIKLINNEKKLNKSASRNLAIDLAKGEYISFLNSGDSLSKKTLKSVFKTFNENSNIDLISIPIYIGPEKKNHILNYKFKDLSDIHIDADNNVVLSDNEYNLNIYDEDLDDVLASSDLFNLHLFKDTKTENFNQDTLSLDDDIFLLDESYNLKLYEDDADELVLAGSGVNTFNNVSIVNLNEFPQAIQTSVNSGFFRFSSIGDIRFDESSDTFADYVFINEILLKKPILALISNLSYYIGENNLKLDSSNSKDFTLIFKEFDSNEYFNSRFKEFYFKLIEKSINYYGHVLEFIQYTIAFDLQYLLKIESVEGNLNNIEFKELYSNLVEVLSYINDEIILNQIDINQSLKSHLLLLKHFKYEYLANKDFKFDADLDDKLSANFIDDLSHSKLELSYKQMNLFKRLVKEDPTYIDSYEIKEDEIHISGIYTSFFDLNLDIVVDLDDSFESITCDKIDSPQRDFYSLNCSYGYNHYFKVKIPLKDLDEEDYLSFSFRVVLNDDILDDYDGFINDNSYDLKIDFSEDCKVSKIAKYQLNNDYISEIENNKIIVNKRNTVRLLKFGSKNLFKILTKKEDNSDNSTLKEIHLLYKELSSKTTEEDN